MLQVIRYMCMYILESWIQEQTRTKGSSTKTGGCIVSDFLGLRFDITLLIRQFPSCYCFMESDIKQVSWIRNKGLYRIQIRPCGFHALPSEFHCLFPMHNVPVHMPHGPLIAILF